MILSGDELRLYIESKRLIVDPYDKDIIRENGLDLRLGKQIARMKKTKKIFDSKKERNTKRFYRFEDVDNFVINPNERILANTLEYLELPTDLVAYIQLRSSYARMGLSIPPTNVEAGFKGELTIEIIGSNFPIRLYSGERFVRLLFSKVSMPPSQPYKGKYSGQRGVTLPKI